MGSNPFSISANKNSRPKAAFLLAEMEGFEPPHALRRLADFESAPFSHLGTSPKSSLLYQCQVKKSSFFLIRIVLFYQFQHFPHLFTNGRIILSEVGSQAAGAILDPIFRIAKSAAAAVAKTIQRTIAEKAAEGFRIRSMMAGKIFTFSVLKKIIMAHVATSIITDAIPEMTHCRSIQ